ncbi:MAG TPA: MATE family efflux transporter [Candidatus Merdivicinus intestinavium]|nr:MATE family efflux transporter [Candidatus Merdivicinus intestinavium]
MSKRIDLLTGSIISPLVRLALPIMGTSLIQMAYNMVDMIWIGRVGAGAVAAVGAAGMFMWLSNGLMVLARMGGQVYTAQSLGAGKLREAGRYAQCSIQLGAVFAVLYTIAMVVFCKPLVGFFNLNSPQVVRDAESYLWLVSLGTLPSFLNQIFTALITTSGNSRTPFLVMGAGLVINMVLDPVLIFGVGPVPAMGAAGAAIATTLAQVVVTLLFFLYIRRDDHLFANVRLFSKPDWSCCRSILRLGAPSAAQSCIFPLISMVIARIIAGWGDEAVAVQKVGSQIESISWMMADGFSVAVNSFVAQNFGARNFQRARKGYRVSMGVSTVWGLFCSVLLMTAGGLIFRIFIPDAALLPMGVDYLTILGLSQMFMCWESVTSGAYSGFGHTLTPSLVSIILTAARIPAAMLLSATPLELNGIWWSISLSSICKGLLLVILFALFLRKLTAKQARAAD